MKLMLKFEECNVLMVISLHRLFILLYIYQPFIESTTAQLINNQSFKKKVNLLMLSTGQP